MRASFVGEVFSETGQPAGSPGVAQKCDAQGCSGA